MVVPMSSQNRRKQNRVSLGYEAVIHSGRVLIARCNVLDISAEGARLFVNDSANAIPAEFVLRLSRNGKIERGCHLVWREQNEIGVHFSS
jgi:hypothetical protein